MTDREPRPSLTRTVVVAAVIAAAAAGGWLLAADVADGTHDPPAVLPLLLVAAAGVGLLFLTRDQALPTPDRPDPSILPSPRPLPAAAFAALAAVLTGVVLLWVPTLGDQDSYAIPVAAWLAAAAAWFSAVSLLAPPAPPGGFRRPSATALALAAAVAAALALRVVGLGSVPFTLGGDEASQGLEAIEVLEGELRNPFSTSWYSVPTMSFFFQSVWLRLAGATIFGLRLPWALVGTAAVMVSYFLVRRLAGPAMAFATAIALAGYHFHIHYSRLGSNQIADTLCVAAVLLFLARGLDGTRWRLLDWAAAGGLCAVAFAWYAGARLAAVLALAVLGYAFLLEPRRFFRRHAAGVVAGVLSFLVVGAPMLQYAARFPAEFNGRVNQVGIIQSGWLAAEVEITGQSTGTILLDQLRRAGLAFNYYPDRRVWYGLDGPLLDPVFGTVFLLGLVYALVAVFTRRGQTRLAPLVAWWWGGMLLGGMLTESPPSSQRLITLAVPTCFFIVLGLTRLAQAVRRAAVPRLPVAALVLGVTAVFSVTSAVSYFADYSPRRIYGGAHAELATVLAPELLERRERQRVVFLGQPFMYFDFSTISYLAPGVTALDVAEPLTEPPPVRWCSEGRDLLVVAVPPRAAEIGLVRQAFPGGREREIRSEGSHHGLLAVVYEVSCAELGERRGSEGLSGGTEG